MAEAPNRARVNELGQDALVEIANNRSGSNAFNAWAHGEIRKPVNIAGVVLEEGDAVLFIPALGSAIKVWSPLVTKTEVFVLPATHVAQIIPEDSEW